MITGNAESEDKVKPLRGGLRKVIAKTVDKMTSEANFELLTRSGIKSPFERAPEEPLASEEMLSPYHIDAWVRMWRLGLKGEKKVTIMECSFLSMISAVSLKRDDNAYGMNAKDLEPQHEKRMSYLKREWDEHDCLVLPVYEGMHFTLLLSLIHI